jgi:hypothetical protein
VTMLALRTRTARGFCQASLCGRRKGRRFDTGRDQLPPASAEPKGAARPNRRGGHRGSYGFGRLDLHQSAQPTHWYPPSRASDRSRPPGLTARWLAAERRNPCVAGQEHSGFDRIYCRWRPAPVTTGPVTPAQPEAIGQRGVAGETLVATRSIEPASDRHRPGVQTSLMTSPAREPRLPLCRSTEAPEERTARTRCDAVASRSSTPRAFDRLQTISSPRRTSRA